MKFNDIQQKLLNQEKIVTYKSISSEKIHQKKCTIPRKFQRESDKIVVWDISDQKWIDIEVSTIIDIE